MPPAIYVAGDTAGAPAGASELELLTPSTTRAGDTMLAIVVTHVDVEVEVGDEWTILADLTTPEDGRITILRRPARDGDASSVSLPFAGGSAVERSIAALLILRGVDPHAELVASDAVDVSGAQEFPCPSLELAAYSDLYLGIVAAISDETTFAQPSDARLLIEGDGDGMTIAVFGRWPETPGPTGTQEATAALEVAGVAAAIALSADALRGLGKSFAFDPPGAIGLPTEGV